MFAFRPVFWSRTLDGLEQVSAGKHMLGIIPQSAHCYRVGSTLIDAGPPHQASHIVDHFGDTIEHVILTHHHEDHVGAAWHFQAQGARVYAPKKSKPLLEDPPGIMPYQERLWGNPRPVEAEPVGDQVKTPDVTLDVVPAPGHSKDHVAYLEADRGWLFTGDAYLGARDILRSCERLGPLIASLETLQRLDANKIYPGHGSTQETPQRAIQETLDHYEARLEETKRLRDEHTTPRTLRKHMLGREPPIRYVTRGDFSKQHFANELLHVLKERT